MKNQGHLIIFLFLGFASLVYVFPSTFVDATKVDKVMTAVLGINNADASVCVEKVIDSKP
jgi:sensor c-di-GMP phosphodiesterase-like protein